MNRVVDLNSPFIEILNLVYFIQEKIQFGILINEQPPTINTCVFLNKRSEIGFVNKFYGFVCFVQDAQADLQQSWTKYCRQVNESK